jgi:hypothetical protein
MTIMAIRDKCDRDLLVGVAALVVIGTVLLALAPAKVRTAAASTS